MNILFFASFRERLQSDSEQWDHSRECSTVQDVLLILQSRGEPWESVLQAERLLIAVNQEMATLDTPVSFGDEIAFFPPVTGG